MHFYYFVLPLILVNVLPMLKPATQSFEYIKIYKNISKYIKMILNTFYFSIWFLVHCECSTVLDRTFLFKGSVHKRGKDRH